MNPARSEDRPKDRPRHRPQDRPERPRAVIFDWDHTLVDNWDAIRAALNFTLTSFGQPE